ncbi:MAG: hypothetical protein ACI87Q_000720 [Pseudohongiellaceae bacterium]|jgi:hypothetical protein
MADVFCYNSDLTGGSLMVRESRVIADLLLCHADSATWKRAIFEENRLQKPSASSAKRNSQAIRKRLERMEPEFWRAIRDGDDELATQASLCTVLERNLLLVEFIETVVKDAHTMRDEKLEFYQWSEFLEHQAHRAPEIDGWKPSTRKKMGEVAFRILAEANYLKSTRNPVLQNVLVRSEIRSMLENTYRQRILRCLETSTRRA